MALIILAAIITTNLVLWWLYRRDLTKTIRVQSDYVFELETDNYQLRCYCRNLEIQNKQLHEAIDIGAMYCSIVAVHDVYLNDGMMYRYVKGLN